MKKIIILPIILVTSFTVLLTIYPIFLVPLCLALVLLALCCVFLLDSYLKSCKQGETSQELLDRISNIEFGLQMQKQNGRKFQ